MAAWADTVRRSPEYAWSGPLHFINTPDWNCHYSRDRDCVDESGTPMFCVDGAIQNYSTRTSNSGIGQDQQAEALKFLVHFVGDVHQPLHCGFTSDAGGNDIYGYWYNRQANLHHIWDSDIIVKRLDDFAGDQDAYAQWLVQKIRGDWSGDAGKWASCSNSTTEDDGDGHMGVGERATPFNACSDQWAVESVGFACSNAYVDSDGTTHITEGFMLGDDYYQHNVDVVDRQLAKAAVRLSNVLNSIWQ